ncbi:MAG: hypothetical protein KF683_05770 [Rubrivivax sp.]|nr:hypothetical protein [Rubrivivax sp.]
MNPIDCKAGLRAGLPPALLLALAAVTLPVQAADYGWTSGAYLAQGLPNPLLAGDRVIATGAAAKTFAGVIFNQGTISWQTTATATLSGGGTVLHNAGLFDLLADAAIAWNASQGVTFDNTGLLRKSGGDGTSVITARMVNRDGGVLQADSGTLAYRGNVNRFEEGTLFAGSGRHRLDWSSEYNFSGLLINNSTELNLASGRFVSLDQRSTAIRGQVVWTGGEFQGHWRLEEPSLLVVSSGAAKTLSGSFDNQGLVRWGANSALVLSGAGTVWRNAGTFDLQTDADIVWNGNQGAGFDNTGLLRKSGGDGTSAITAHIVNRAGGILQADSGTLAYRGNQNLFEAGTLFAGSGRHRLDWSSTYTFSELLINTSAELNLASGRFVSLDERGTAVRGQVVWSGGEIQASWTLEAQSLMKGQAGAAKTLSGRLDNEGRVEWETGNPLVLSGAGTAWHNAGSFDLQADASIVWNGSQDVRFDNTGLLRKSGGSGTSTISSKLSNTGIIEVTSGTLALPAGFFNEGLLRGTASFAATLLDNRGTIAPGLPVGEERIATLRLAGALLQSAGAVFEVDVGALAASDLLVVTGNAHFDGTVRVVSLSGYQAQVGDRFRVATFAAHSGGFDAFELVGFGHGTRFDADFGVGWLDLVVTAVPEPPAGALWLAGALGLLAARRSMRRA